MTRELRCWCVAPFPLPARLGWNRRLEQIRATHLATHALVGLASGVIVAGGLFAFIVSFENFEMTPFLTAPGLTTLPIAVLGYLHYHIDPLIAALAVARMVLVGGALVLLDRQVRIAQVAF